MRYTALQHKCPLMFDLSSRLTFEGEEPKGRTTTKKANSNIKAKVVSHVTPAALTPVVVSVAN